MSDRRPSSCAVAALAAVLVVAGVNGAGAQEAAGPKRADDPAAAEARRHYEDGTKAFNLGEFPRAIAEFKAAYNAKDDPSLLYNIAQAFRLQGDAPQAIFFYRSYLRNMPNTSNRREVEGRIRTLEKQLEDQKKADQKMEAAPGPVVAPPAGAGTAPPAAAPAIEPVAPSARTATGSTKQETAPAPVESALPTAPAPVESTPAASTVDLTRPPADQPASSSPLYKKWWFWTAVGVVAVIGVGAAIAAARDKPPSTSLGLYDPTFVKP